MWFQDEARIGQKNGVVRQWARRGTRPRQPADQRYQSAYLFGAICPARGKGAAMALPFADTAAMQLHLDEISRHVARGAHAVLLLDRAGWHTTAKLKVPKNITPVLLPSRAPELNPVENAWQYLRANWLSNRVFDGHDATPNAGRAVPALVGRTFPSPNWRSRQDQSARLAELGTQPETVARLSRGRGWGGFHALTASSQITFGCAIRTVSVEHGYELPPSFARSKAPFAEEAHHCAVPGDAGRSPYPLL